MPQLIIVCDCSAQNLIKEGNPLICSACGKKVKLEYDRKLKAYKVK